MITRRLIPWLGVFCAIATVGLVLCTSSAISAPIIQYESVINKPGAPTAGNGFQAQIGSVYVDRTTQKMYVKTAAAATSWSEVIAVSGDGTFNSVTVGNGGLSVASGVLNASPSGAVTIDDAVMTPGTTQALFVSNSTGNATYAIKTTGLIMENGWTPQVQAADQDVTNAQDQTSNTFTLAVTSGNSYALECRLYVGSDNAANDFEFRVSSSAGIMTGRGLAIALTAGDAATVATIQAAGAANTNQIPVGTFTGATNPTAVSFDYAWAQTVANATVRVQFGNNVTGVGIKSRMLKGSRCRWKQTN